jgi:hypothetical protein
MGLTLPPLLETLLNDLGFTWPEVDETELASLAATWGAFGNTLDAAAQAAHSTTRDLAAVNQGEAMDAFARAWSGPRAPAPTLEHAAVGVDAGAAAILVCAGITLALKVNTAINLTILAVEISEAIATAPPTFGASLLEIPVFREVTSRIIGALVAEAVNAVIS